MSSILWISKGTRPQLPQDHNGGHGTALQNLTTFIHTNGQTEIEIPWPPPPYPHIIGLEIRGVPSAKYGGAGKPGSGRRPGGAVKMSQATAFMALCFQSEDEAEMVMAAAIEH